MNDGPAGPQDRGARGNVVPLGTEPPPAPPPRISRPRGVHGVAIASTAVFTVIAILSFIAFITVRWPDDTGRVVMAVFLFAVVGAIASSSAAVLTAARATYVVYRDLPEAEDDRAAPEEGPD